MLSLLDQIKVKFRHLVLPQEALAHLASPHQSILDIGCGMGIFLTTLTGQGKTLRGVEISDLMVQKAKNLLAQKRIQDIEIAYFNGDPTTISNCKDYDVIFLNDVLHHIPPKDQTDFLKKIYQKMRKGAQFVLKDIDASSPLVFFNKLHDLVLNKQYPHEQSMADCYQVCQRLGFQIDERISIRKLVYPHFILVMTKM